MGRCISIYLVSVEEYTAVTFRFDGSRPTHPYIESTNLMHIEEPRFILGTEIPHKIVPLLYQIEES